MPTNDNFADAIALTGNSYTGDNTGFTKESGEPSSLYNTAWHTWTANGSFNGNAYFSIFPNFSGEVKIYTGSSVGSLTLVNGGLPYFTPTPGIIYKIQVGSLTLGDTGQYFLTYTDPSYIKPAGVPTNNNFASATVLTGSSVNGDTSNATKEVSEPFPFTSGLGSVWYKWTPGSKIWGWADFSLQWKNQQSSFGNTGYAIYRGTALNNLTTEAAFVGAVSDPNYPISLSFRPEQYVDYWIQVVGGETGSFTLTYPNKNLSNPGRSRWGLPLVSY